MLSAISSTQMPWALTENAEQKLHPFSGWIVF